MATQTPATPTTDSDIGDPVARAARHLWESTGEESQVRPWAALAAEIGLQDSDSVMHFTVVVPRLRRIECIINDRDKLPAARDRINALLSRGYEVDALMPVQFLGAGHEAFRGCRIRLQGWWERKEHGLAFTTPEIP